MAKAVKKEAQKKINILEVTLSEEKQAEVTQKAQDLADSYEWAAHLDNPYLWECTAAIYNTKSALEEEIFTFQKSIQCTEKINKLEIEEFPVGLSLPHKYIFLGKTFSKNKQEEKALIAFEKSIELNKCNPVANLGIGKIYQEQKEYSKALGYYKLGLSQIGEIDKKEPFNYQNKMGRRERSFCQLGFTVRGKLGNNAGVCSYNLEKHEECFEYTNSVIKENNNKEDTLLAFYYRGGALLKMGEPYLAESDFKKAIIQAKEEGGQEYVEVMTYAASWHFYKAGNEGKAIEFFETLIKNSEKISEFNKASDLCLLSEHGKKAYVAIELIANKDSLKVAQKKFPQYKNLETTLTAKDLAELKIS